VLAASSVVAAVRSALLVLSLFPDCFCFPCNPRILAVLFD
jgi:hypothetical protein